MSPVVPLGRDLGLLSSVEIRPVGLDDLSAVRYIHTSSFRSLASAHLAEAEIDGFCNLVNSQDYAQNLLGDDLIAAWLGPEMLGTAGWSPGESTGATARIHSVFVSPLFTRCGIGRLLVESVECNALSRGFRAFSVRATPNSVGFFETLGYRVTSYGARAVAGTPGLPVAFLRKTTPEAAASMARTAQVV